MRKEKRGSQEGDIAIEAINKIIDVFKRNGFFLREDTIQEIASILNSYVVAKKNYNKKLGGDDTNGGT